MSKKLIASLAIAFATGATQAAVVDFQDVSEGSCAFYGPSVTSQGFIFTGNPVDPSLFGCRAGIIGNNTSNALINANNQSIVFMSKNGGGAFSLASFEAGNRADPDSYGTTFSIDIMGMINGGGTVSHTVALNGDDFGFFTLGSGFSNLTSVSFTARGVPSVFLGRGPEFLIDNITVGPAFSAVPEPATLSLLGLGLLGFAATRRNRRK
jgi:hypothetical protein